MELRRLHLGELIDYSVALWRMHWRSLLSLSIGFQLAQFIVLQLGEIFARKLFPNILTSSAMLALNNSTASSSQLLGVLACFMAVGLCVFFISQLAGVAFTHSLYPRLLRRAAPDSKTTLSFTVRHLGVTFKAFVLSILWTCIVALLFFAPGALCALTSLLLDAISKAAGIMFLVIAGILFALGLVGLVLWYMMRFLLSSQVIALEHGGPLTVFRRTGALSSGRVAHGLRGLVKIRLMVLVTVIGVLLLVIALLSSLPSLLFGLVYGASFQPGNTLSDVMPQPLLVLVQLIQVILTSVFAPLYVAFQLMFYVDMRIRREGLDLEMKLSS